MKKYMFAVLIVATTLRPMEVKSPENLNITSSSVQKTIPMQKKETDPLMIIAKKYGFNIKPAEPSVNKSTIFVVNKDSSKPNCAFVSKL